MMAAIRSRSASLMTSRGVRLKTSMKSAKVLGVYLGGLAEGFLVRYLSSLGSSQRTNLCIKLLNMILYIITLKE